MGMNDTPSGNRLQIGFFGKRNAGKSSVVNALTGQALSIVSEQKGTTTDPVAKAMELLPLGPVVIIDTPGYDDEGTLGALRVEKTKQVLRRTDFAVLVADASTGLTETDAELTGLFQERNIPYLIAYNKADLLEKIPAGEEKAVYLSAKERYGIEMLKERVAKLAVPQETDRRLVGDLLSPGDLVVLVVPIDKAAPKGRLILPQQQAIRDILDAGAVSVVTGVEELSHTLSLLTKRPALVITDSQVFGQAAAAVPEEILLTSFSILMARYKGFLETAVKGAAALNSLRDGDRVLISEGCTHHRQCGDIGTVKLPALLKKYTGKELLLSFTSGQDFVEDLSPYRLVIHCGGCMLNSREMEYRKNHALTQGVAFTNYGTALAQMNGILERSLRLFPALAKELQPSRREG